MPKQDTELREIVLQMYFMEEFEDYTYEQLEKNFDKTQLPKIEERLKLWRDKSVNEARKENARLLNAVGLMYAQYCKKKLGHDFMGAGEAAIEILEDYEIHDENWEWTDKSYDKLEAVVAHLNKKGDK